MSDIHNIKCFCLTYIAYKRCDTMMLLCMVTLVFNVGEFRVNIVFHVVVTQSRSGILAFLSAYCMLLFLLFLLFF